MRRAIACLTLFASSAYAINTGEVALRGYTPEHAAAEVQWEQKFRDVPDPAKVREGIRPNTRMLWLETPSNPMLKIFDIAALADITGDLPGKIIGRKPRKTHRPGLHRAIKGAMRILLAYCPSNNLLKVHLHAFLEEMLR